MTNVLQSTEMLEKPISVRLDADAQRALDRLTAAGVSQSEAIRQALIKAARLERLERMEADAKRVGQDPRDRAVVAEIRAFMDELRPAW